jgi:CRISPR system Cascade subunit CasA
MNKSEYNLLDEKWIRVLDEGETLTETSLLEVFEHAHLYRRLANETETVDVSILRLLLAIMYAALTPTVNESAESALLRWQALWEREALLYAQIKEYIECFRERFYLFHPEAPFYQAADLASRKCADYEASKLIGDLAQNGNKVQLFVSRTDSKSVGYPEAARWLLHLNAFDDSSVKPSVRGTGTEPPGVGWLGKLGLIFLEGKNLLETLLLNFVLFDADGRTYRGKPIWEMPIRTDERIKIEQPSSFAELYTLQSRRILLTRKDDAVVGYKLLGGEFFDEENAFIEQMTIWRRDPKTENFTPLHHKADRSLWRDLPALVASGDTSRQPGVVRWIEALINKKIISDMQLKFSSASIQYDKLLMKTNDMFSDGLSIPSAVFGRVDLCAAVLRVAEATNTALRAFGYLASDLALASGLNAKAALKISKIRAEAVFRAQWEIDKPVRTWLSEISADDDAEKAYKKIADALKAIFMRMLDEEINAVSDKAFIGRDGKTAAHAEIFFKSKIRKTLGEEDSADEADLLEGIKELRRKLGWSQARMSEELGIPKRTVEHWDMGTRMPPDWVAKLVKEKLERLLKKT